MFSEHTFKSKCMLMKKVILACVVLMCYKAESQVAINTTATTPNASAMLDISSNTRGLLIPRLTTSQRNAIASPANSLMVFDSTTLSFWYYKTGTGWLELASNPVGLTLPYSGSANSSQTLFAISNTGSGIAISGNGASGTGIYAVTGSSFSAGLLGDNTNGGEAVTGRTKTVGSATGAVVGRNDGPGYGVKGFVATDSSGNGIAVYGQVGVNNSTGVAGRFENSKAANAQTTLQAVTNGTGSALTADNTNASSTANTVNVTGIGPGVIADHSQGNAGNFFMNNTNGVGAGVRGEVNSIFGNNGTAGVYGVASGTGGYGGYFEHSNTTGYGLSLQAVTQGQGKVAGFYTYNATNSQPTVDASTSGTGSAGNFSNTNSANTANTLYVTSNGPGVIADHSQGNAGNFFMNNTSGVGAGVRGEVNSIFGNNGTAGVYGVASGTGGYAGYFEHTETTGYGITLEVISHDNGSAMVVDHEGTGNIAIFQATGSNVARIDRTGKGFFNGGTQNSGADIAESFAIEGNRDEYGPGDVMIISRRSDRTLEKSDTAYSALVAGVFATKPGVLLTEKNMDETIDGDIPLGVVGVIPTKVCNENGAIKRGDILVTSDHPGFAMKANPTRIKVGEAIGKALENFDETTGVIKVLVNVK